MRQHPILIQHPLNQHFQRTAGGLAAEQARRNHAGIVEHHQIARAQIAQQIDKLSVGDAAARAIQTQQAAAAPLGQRVLRYASLDDIAIWAVLALILLDWPRMERQLGFLLCFPFVAWAMRALMQRMAPADRLRLSMVWLALAGLAADWAGLHFMVDAFLAGVVLDRSWFDGEALDRLRDMLLLTVMPVFFLSTGLRTVWVMGGVELVAAALLLLAAAVGGKLLGVRIAGRLLGWARGEASVIGWLLQTKALIMIIFVNILLDRQVISGATFTALLLMALASTMLTTPMARRGLRRLEADPGDGDQTSPDAGRTPRLDQDAGLE